MAAGCDQILVEPIHGGRVSQRKARAVRGPPPVGGCQSENDMTLASLSSMTRRPPGPAASAWTSSPSNSRPTNR